VVAIADEWRVVAGAITFRVFARVSTRSSIMLDCLVLASAAQQQCSLSKNVVELFALAPSLVTVPSSTAGSAGVVMSKPMPAEASTLGDAIYAALIAFSTFPSNLHCSKPVGTLSC